jgi:hypothetical protein
VFWGSIRFWVRASAKIFWVSVIGILVYRLEMSKEAGRNWGSIGVWLSLCIRSLEFCILKALGMGLGGLLSA